jgi:peptide deformylase
MIYPVVAYGHPVLRKVAKEIDKDHPNIREIISNMFETMYVSVGVGLAAPQINQSIRLIVIDSNPYKIDFPEAEGFKKVLINPEIIIENAGS